MSQENVEIVRRAYASFERRDWDSIADIFDPDVEQHGTVGGVEEGNVARGALAVRAIWETEDEEVWDEHRLEPVQFFDAGDRVVVFQREYQRGKSSGVELVVETASILDLRDGRIVRMQGYMDRAAALSAAGLPERETGLSQRFRDLTEDAWLQANLDAESQGEQALPSLPDETTQLRFAGKAGDEALVEGHMLARTFKDLYREHVGPFTPTTRVLDYGCGWGRITRFFLKDVSGESLWGIDCNERLIDFCRESNPWCRFEVNDPLPPTDLPAGHFDLAFSYSVFTHLREDVHLAWLDELRRVVKPGGLLILTVRPRHFISYCAGLTAESTPQSALVDLFSDPDEALRDYDSGRFVYVPYRASGYGEWWGEACISHAYVEREWPARGFELLDFVEDPSRFKQNVVVLRAVERG